MYKHFVPLLVTLFVTAMTLACAAQRSAAIAPASTAPAPPSATVPPDNRDSLARGRQRYESYKCFECHGRNGEGTDDAPDLTHSKLTAPEIAAFLEKPSPHARSIGMPSIPADSPDLQPLVTFVLSFKQP